MFSNRTSCDWYDDGDDVQSNRVRLSLHSNSPTQLISYPFPYQAIKEIRKLRKQLTSEINLSVAGVNVAVDPEMKPPNDNQARLLRQLVLSGLGDQVGKKIALDEVKQGLLGIIIIIRNVFLNIISSVLFSFSFFGK